MSLTNSGSPPERFPSTPGTDCRLKRTRRSSLPSGGERREVTGGPEEFFLLIIFTDEPVMFGQLHDQYLSDFTEGLIDGGF